ncbi:recombinase family protein [Deinococcus radiomollis]|uniref:recombinase family protein n=1 Tax=Deinococcus radiomollis TaxID=468916 RepID=UPI0038913672
MTRVALYTRVSSDTQVENHSLEAQASTLEAHAAAQNWDVQARYSDPGYSGTTADRPALTTMLSAAKAGQLDVVLVYRLDRLARKPALAYRLIEELSQAGVAFVSVTEAGIDTRTAMGRVALGIGATFAEWERDTFIQRSKAGMLKAIEKGQWPGGITPYGYRVEDRRLVIDEQAAEAVRLIYHLCAVDGYSTIRISDHLTGLGIPPHYQLAGRGVRGKSTVVHWRPGGVLRILKNPVYKGLPEYGKRNTRAGKSGATITVGTAPVLIDPATWEKAQATLARNSNLASRNSKTVYMLRSLIKCGRCGRSYVGSKSADKPAHYYGCNGRTVRGGRPESERCTNPFVRGQDLDEHVRQGIRQILGAPEATLAAREMTAPEVLTGQLAQAQRAITDVLAQRSRLLDVYLSGDLDKAAFVERQAGIDARLSALNATLDGLRDAERQADAAAARRRDLLALSAEMNGQLDTLSELEWQRLAHQLVDRVLVGLDGVPEVSWKL